MKRKTAKEILSDSFRELAQVKSVDRITVKDITDNCGYSQATFYRQFRDKYDLIIWDYTQTVAEIVGKGGKDGYEWRKTLLETAYFFENKKEYLSNLFLHTSGMDSFVQYMSDIHAGSLTKLILECSGRDKLDLQTKMLIRLYCHGAVCLTCEWILGRYEVSPEELADVFEKALPAPLHPFLFKK